MINAVFDGGRQDFLDRLIEVGGEALVAILEHCPGCPTGHPVSLALWLDEQTEMPELFYIGPVGASTGEIRKEDALYREIEQFVDGQVQTGGFDEWNPVQIRNAVRNHVFKRADLPHDVRPAPAIQLRLLRWFALVRGV